MFIKKSRVTASLLIFSISAYAQPSGRPLMNGPPPEARQACADRGDGDSCGFKAPHGQIDGVCRVVPEGRVCVPSDQSRQRMSNSRMQVSADDGRSMQSGSPFGAEIAGTNPEAIRVRSKLPDTHQGSCFDDQKVIPCPKQGQPYYGQDAQYLGAEPNYTVYSNEMVQDHVTGLIWQKAHNPIRLDWYSARQTCSNLRLGGFQDWRLPSIRELFSIADFRGSVGRRPYLDNVFEIREPDASVLEGDRFAQTHRTEMMGQTWSSTLYTGDHWGRKGVEAAFFMNFLDGHIKQAPTRGGQKLFYRCVRGSVWGTNDYVDNKNGTVTDRASGLMWQQSDDGVKRDWPGALSYCSNQRYAGYEDWRLPNIKELQSIVDYTRHDPAIDERFLRQSDRNAWFWSSTTHGDNVRQADYICFGKCTSIGSVDVHGAGAQRSDPKRRGLIHRQSQGGQNDEIRIDNFVRCVR